MANNIQPGDELEYTCLVDKTRKSTAWMFWGSFHGTQKGTCLFWEKNWGSITGPSYCEHIVPHVADYMEVNPELQFMQDNAPPHKAAFTRESLRVKNIEPINWPPYSPDLNPIEAVWSEMKDYIENQYPELEDGRERSSAELRIIILEAWDSISHNSLQYLIGSMPARCQAVIVAGGGATRY